ncbi:MAG: hypothetical protein ACYDHF_05910 [Candidatus Cryosericum sp.]
MNDTDESGKAVECDPGATDEMTSPESLHEDQEALGNSIAAEPSPPRDSAAVPMQKPHRKTLKTLTIVVACLVVAAIGTAGGLFLQSRATADRIVSSIQQRDDKLVERSKSALAITTNLKFSDAMAETDAVMSERSALINEIGQQTSSFFQSKLDAAKADLIAENDQLAKDQIAGLHKQLEPLVQRDNVALGDIFIIADENSTLSWKESWDAVDKNVADRVMLINEIKLMPSLKYASILSGYVTLLGTENDFCRTYGRYLRALFDYSVEVDYYSSSYYADYDNVVSARKKADEARVEFNSKYTALLKQDKAFWPTATAILPTRDLQGALAQFYKDVNGTTSGGKT